MELSPPGSRRRCGGCRLPPDRPQCYVAGSQQYSLRSFNSSYAFRDITLRVWQPQLSFKSRSPSSSEAPPHRADGTQMEKPKEVRSQLSGWDCVDELSSLQRSHSSALAFSRVLHAAPSAAATSSRIPLFTVISFSMAVVSKPADMQRHTPTDSQRACVLLQLTSSIEAASRIRQENSLVLFRCMQVVPDLCRGFVVAEEEREVTTRDCILYALGTAACQDPLDEEDLRYCYEGSSLGFAVLPTFATTLMPVAGIFEGLDKCPGLPAFNPMKLLHGEHKVTLLRPLQPDVKVKSRTVIKDVLDKRSGALVALRVETFVGNDLLCVNDFQLFIRGIGGFGGPSSSAASLPAPEAPLGPPEKTMEAVTQANLALIYRLSGDYNPLHVSRRT
ncbi:hypothetical protein Efla_006348 [Eimeria flavescens]